MKKLELIDDCRCFVCGKENPEGLRLDWKVEGQETSAEYIPEPKYQGWKGILHGGIISTLLDEAMTRLASVLFGSAVTAEMTIRFVAPARIGERLFIRGEIVKDSRKIVEMKASITAAGAVIAHATGKVIKL